jgi:hypothetical protein
LVATKLWSCVDSQASRAAEIRASTRQPLDMSASRAVDEGSCKS